MQVTEHFTHAELIHSDLARQSGIPNEPGQVEMARLKTLAVSVLEPWRRIVGAIKVNSAFRSSRVNQLAGGAPDSQHLLGEAADCEPLECPLREAFIRLIRHCDFDQAILENDQWIHVSFTTRRANRRMALVMTLVKGKKKYSPFTE